MKRKKKFLWLKVLVIVYCIVGLLLYYLQEKLLFHPEALPADHKFAFKENFEELRIPFNEEDTLSMIRFIPQSPARGAVLYFHGNMRNVERYAGAASTFLDRGYEVWMPDYPGFGKSTGRITEQKLYEQGLAVRKLVGAKFPDNSIILYGRSLGSGIAGHVASATGARMLILETPYYSVRALFSRYAFIYPLSLMLRYEFPLYRFLEHLKMPVYIFHGTADRVIPYSHAERLKKFTDDSGFFKIDNAGHNDVSTSPLYLKTIDSLVK